MNTISDYRYRIWPDIQGGYVVRDRERHDEVVSEVKLSRSQAQKEARALNGIEEVPIPRIPGAKWLREANYIPASTKRIVVKAIEECKKEFPTEPVAIRPASYVGPDSSTVVVCYGVGQRIFRSI